MSTIVGSEGKSIVTTILREVVGLEVAVKYSGQGKKQKKNFSATTLYKLIKGLYNFVEYPTIIYQQLKLVSRKYAAL